MMKTTLRIAVSIFLVLNTFLASGQKVTDVCVSMSNGLQCGISVVIPNTTKEELLESWENEVKSQSQYTIKTQKVGGELQLQSAALKGINSRLNIFTVSYERGNEAELITFYELPSGFIEPEKDKVEYLTIKKFVQEFAADVYQQTVGDNLKEEKKAVKELERDIKKLQRKKDRVIKKMEEKKSEINEMRNADIPKIESEKALKRKQIEDRNAQKRDLKHEDMKDQAQKLVNEREKELRKLGKDQEKLEKEIVKCEEDVREMERELEDYNTEIDQKTEQLNQQQGKVKKLDGMLD
jgi:hypothetical protein